MSTIFLGLAGMAVIFGAAGGAPAPRAGGDWMGLTAGVTWAVALVHLKRSAARPVFDRVFFLFVLLAPVFFLTARIPGAQPLAPFAAARLLDAAPWLLAFSLAWMLPVIWLTIFGASRLDPGRVAILLMLEILVGLTTAALLADEPFGVREAVGGSLILAASGAELTGRRRTSLADSRTTAVRGPGAPSGLW